MTIATVLLVLALARTAYGAPGYRCDGDGLQPDYDNDCMQYYKCSGGSAVAKYECEEGRVFSAAEGACVRRRGALCVRRQCHPRDRLSYVTPGTGCKLYYSCVNGTRVERACPGGGWFDFEKQSCSRGIGLCYEPLCAGLPNGEYPDPTQDCYRKMQCEGAKLRGVVSCGGQQCPGECPSASSSSIPVPTGDATLCADSHCDALCSGKEDGSYPDTSVECSEYYTCAGGRVVRRGACPPSMAFAEGSCKFGAACAEERAPCRGQPDGVHRDPGHCGSWFECRRERVKAQGTCDGGMVFDGAGCVSAGSFSCSSSASAPECEARPSGAYPHLASNCSRYYHCHGSRSTLLECPAGRVFDGSACVPADHFLCPSLEPDSCYGRPDGKYRMHGFSCRSYYMCVNGTQVVNFCLRGEAFDGKDCVPATRALCPEGDRTCEGLPDGYNANKKSGCRKYFYCDNGDHLMTLRCTGGRVFDGKACVTGDGCPAGRGRGTAGITWTSHSLSSDSSQLCTRDGFFVVQGTNCSEYYFCITGARTSLRCQADHAFNGDICVPRTRYTCPG